MLEVGNMATFEEDRAHFGAWCVVSSPLILGYDLTNDNITAKIWPIISNTEAIKVNQQWAGHPGRLVKAWNVHSAPVNASDRFLQANACNRSLSYEQWGFSYDASKQAITKASPLGGPKLCVDAKLSEQLQLLPCDGSATQQWKYQLRSSHCVNHRE